MTATLDSTARAGTPGDWESIRHVFYVTLGWLLATGVAVLLLVTVVPALFWLERALF